MIITGLKQLLSFRSVVPETVISTDQYKRHLVSMWRGITASTHYVRQFFHNYCIIIVSSFSFSSYWYHSEGSTGTILFACQSSDDRQIKLCWIRISFKASKSSLSNLKLLLHSLAFQSFRVLLSARIIIIIIQTFPSLSVSHCQWALYWWIFSMHYKKQSKS